VLLLPFPENIFPLEKHLSISLGISLNPSTSAIWVCKRTTEYSGTDQEQESTGVPNIISGLSEGKMKTGD